MPNILLDEQEIDDLAAYLMSMSPPDK
jgi:mono/diheme cytochrome c family protein